MADQHGPDDATPIIGVAAFQLNSASAQLTRAAHYLGMSAYAFGGPGLRAAVQDDGDYLRIPHVSSASGDEFERYRREQSALDHLMRQSLRHHPSTAIPSRPDLSDLNSLWSEIDSDHSATTLLALLNAAQQSVSSSQIETVAAAASLAAFSRQQLSLSTDILQRATNSSDAMVREIALRALIPSTYTQAEIRPKPIRKTATRTKGPVSTTIHGTWALVSDEGWHLPGSPLHSHLRERTNRNLYGKSDYYRWSGGYTDAARAVAATELDRWRKHVSPNQHLDIVFAHSHGGNVALSAAATGTPIRLLVLLHTPASHRTDEEWTAIRQHVRGVIAMRTRLDLVLLADSVKSGENRLRFDPQKLPHFPVVEHWKSRDAWFSHSRFVTLDVWERFKLADLVKSRYTYT